MPALSAVTDGQIRVKLNMTIARDIDIPLTQPAATPPRTTPLARVPVWMWRALMGALARGERQRLNTVPVDSVDYYFDIDYVGDGSKAHKLDVIVPRDSDLQLPVYVYFHGGGWTSGDKASLTKYCAVQAAEGGMIVINANYRMATKFHAGHMLEDGNAVLDWVVRHAAEFGGDASRIVLGGDSAGGHIAALLTASAYNPDLAEHHGITPAVTPSSLRGLVQHCSLPDFSVMFERGFVLGLNFLRMLLPERGNRAVLRQAARFISPIEWLDNGYPPVFVTTSERDFFYGANLNFILALKRRRIPVDALVYGRKNPNARHTWQQDAKHPESREVYRRLSSFVSKVAGAPQPVAA